MNDEKKTPEASEPNASVSPETAKEWMENFGRVMEQMGARKREDGEGDDAPRKPNTIRLSPEDAGQLPEMMLNLFSTALQAAAQKRETASPTQKKEGESHTGPRKTTELEQKLQDGIREHFNAYLDANIREKAEPNGDVELNAAFIQEHGPALFGSVFKGIAQAVLPEDGQIRVPVSSKEASGKPVQLKIDVNSFLARLSTKEKPSE